MHSQEGRRRTDCVGLLGFPDVLNLRNHGVPYLRSINQRRDNVFRNICRIYGKSQSIKNDISEIHGLGISNLTERGYIMLLEDGHPFRACLRRHYIV
eukprot:COSAG05_NODE_1022_length_6130_cov_48.450174_9_plen_96_part_01